MKLRLIPPGEFQRGLPARTARVTRPFWLGSHEVTQGQYEAVTGKNPSWNSNLGPDHPVSRMSWQNAKEFCDQLSARPEEQKAGRRYRLPTEAEWEFACRAGTSTDYAFGDDLRDDQANFAPASQKMSKPVGTFAANAFGLFDMHGNVWEWVNDWYDADYFRNSPANDPPGPANGDRHVVRGGSWWWTTMFPWLKSSARKGELIPYVGSDLGFRVLCEIVPPQSASAFPPLDPAWEKAIAAMKPDQQIEAVMAELVKRNAGFNGKVESRAIDKSIVTSLAFLTDNVTDITPVRALVGLRSLTLNGSAGPPWYTQRNGKLADLSPLWGMKLTKLEFRGTQVSDLSPLQAMELMHLNCAHTRVSSLEPLKRMKLVQMSCAGTKVSDLSSLEGMPLTYLDAAVTPVASVAPLKGMPLKTLNVILTRVADLTPLQGMELETLYCDFTPARDAPVLRLIKTLQKINSLDAKELLK